MNISNLTCIILFLSVFVTACRKETTVITKACISANRYSIKIHDTIIFTNCSQADYAMVGFKRKGEKLTFLTTDKMLSGDKLSKTFSDTGIFLAVLNTYMNSKNYYGDMDSSLAITVLP